LRALTAILVILTAAVVLVTCTGDERKVSLRFKYEPGMKIRYHQETKGNWNAVMDDSTHERGKTSYWVDVVHTVLEVAPDGTATIRDSANYFRERFDWKDTAKVDTVAETRAATLMVEPNGRCADIIFPPDKDLSAVKWLKAYYDQGAAVYPEGEFSTGYSWTQTTNVLLPEENMKATTTYRVRSFAREGGYDCAVIEYEGTMIIPVEPHAYDSLQTRGYDHISNDGVIYHAYKEGVIVSQKEHWVIKGHRERLKLDREAGKRTDELEQYVINSEANSRFELKELVVP
jgi:hypothetical protein